MKKKFGLDKLLRFQCILYSLRKNIYSYTKERTQDPHKDCSAHEPVNMPTHSGGPVQVEISEEIETGGKGSFPV